MISAVSGFRLFMIFGGLLCLSGCNDGSGDPNAQIGANPVLPELQQYFLPPMHLPGWWDGKTMRRRRSQRD
jgi:hypothetical protein